MRHEPLSAEIRNTRIYYHADGLGSITTLTNHMGLIVQKYDYDAFGNIKFTPFPIWIKQPYMYTGREYDMETGLYYYRARYYDPKVGRFVTKDPILHPAQGNVKSCSVNGLNVPLFENLMAEPKQLNPYTYAVNNPILYVDPLGLACGSGWKQIFVPDNWFGWYNFEGPCTTHDNCYGCEGKKMGKAKSSCDSEFYQGMLSVCNSLSQGSYWKNHCKGAASIYYGYVRKNGQPYFNKARKECCEIK